MTLLNEKDAIPHAEADQSEVSKWGAVSNSLINQLGVDTFERWFEGAAIEVCVAEESCDLRLSTDTHLLWVETNFMPEVQNAVMEVIGENCKVSLSHATETPHKKEQRKTEAKKAQSSSPEESSIDIGALAKRSGLNIDKNFKNFVVGSNSQLAHAACYAISSAAEQVYNPLFIHCPPGLGKTHLVHALGQEALNNDPKKKVVYLTGEKFTNKYIDAVRKGTIDAFRKRYRKVDVLIVDDIQFLVGKGKSQEEFFHTFNTLLESKGQVILTSDRPASEIQTFDARLSSRFEAGLTVSIAKPDFETRVAILQSMLSSMKVTVPDEALYYIAEKVKSNVRRLEGALMRAATHCSLSPEALTIPRLQEILTDILRQENTQRVTIDRIQKEVSEHFDLRLADMTSRKRPANIARARQIAMFLSREMTQNSLADIGENFGGRDHGTVIHACKKIEADLKTDDYIKGEVEFLRAKLVR